MSSELETPCPFAPRLLEGEVWLITGGGTGIGRATAALAARLGASVWITGRREEVLAKASEEIRAAGGDCSFARCDIREPEQIVALVDAIDAKHERVDVLVNNAGGQFISAAEMMSLRGFDSVVRNNLSGTFYVTQIVATRSMIPRRKGVIVNIIANVFRGIPGMAHTAAARAGIDNLTKTLAVEWARHRVRVNAVAPGIVTSEGLAKYPPNLLEGAKSEVPMKRFATPHEIAMPTVFLGSGASAYVTGETLYVDGGQRLWGDTWPIPDDPHPNRNAP